MKQLHIVNAKVLELGVWICFCENSVITVDQIELKFCMAKCSWSGKAYNRCKFFINKVMFMVAVLCLLLAYINWTKKWTDDSNFWITSLDVFLFNTILRANISPPSGPSVFRRRAVRAFADSLTPLQIKKNYWQSRNLILI